MKTPEFLTEHIIIDKGWGKEIIFANNDLYCGKLLIFNPSSTISMHYHMIKIETWYVNEGTFTFRWMDTLSATIQEKVIKTGDVIHLENGVPHQLTTETGGVIFEVSTHDNPEDSYRIIKGDSQN